MFFMISGRAAACGFKIEKKKSKMHPVMQYVIFMWKKTIRLVVPLVIWTLLLVIPTCYIGRMYRSQHNQDPEMNYWDFFIRYFPDEFPKNGLEWLWFLGVLYAIAFVAYPYMKLY